MVAYDRARRLTIFDSRGAIVTHSQVAGPPIGALSADGALISQRLPRALDTRGARSRDSSVYLRADPNRGWTVTDTIGRFPNSDLDITSVSTSASGTVSIGYRQPFARTATALVVAGGFVFGTGDSFKFTFHAPDGIARKVVRVSNTPMPVLPADMAAFIEEYVTGLTAAARDGARRALAAIALPPYQPAFGRILSDGSSRLWIEEFVTTDSASRDWAIFTIDGAVLGRVRTPAGVRVLAVTDTRLAGVRLDALGQEEVVVYTLIDVRQLTSF